MNQRTVSAYVLRSLAQAQTEGRSSTLQTLIDELQIRRADVRSAVSALHRGGYLDVMRMRLTLQGFAVGRALLEKELPEPRPAKVAEAAAA